MLRVAVLISGGGTNLQAIIDRIDSGKITNAQIVKVISDRAGVYGLTRAKNRGIPRCCLVKKEFASKELWEQEMKKQLADCGADLVVLAGFLSILSADFVNRFPDKIINIHPSLIPSFSGEGFWGLKVHRAALEKGVKVSGATVHFVNRQVDGGKIIAQKAVQVHKDDTPETLQKRIMEQAEWLILPQAIDDIANGRI